VLNRILEDATWINIHSLPHDIKVLEVRTREGYGARWFQNPLEFRGFLEPQMPNGHQTGKERERELEREGKGEDATKKKKLTRFLLRVDSLGNLKEKNEDFHFRLLLLLLLLLYPVDQYDVGDHPGKGNELHHPKKYKWGVAIEDSSPQKSKKSGTWEGERGRGKKREEGGGVGVSV
jgi:hypothetical protein